MTQSILHRCYKMSHGILLSLKSLFWYYLVKVLLVLWASKTLCDEYRIRQQSETAIARAEWQNVGMQGNCWTDACTYKARLDKYAQMALFSPENEGKRTNCQTMTFSFHFKSQNENLSETECHTNIIKNIIVILLINIEKNGWTRIIVSICAFVSSLKDGVSKQPYTPRL